MAEEAIQIGGDSKEQVAYKLMLDVFRTEGRHIGSGDQNPNREEIYRTYLECRRAVYGAKPQT